MKYLGSPKYYLRYNKKHYYVLDQDQNRIEIDKCQQCYEIGEVVTEDTKHLDPDFYWEWEECDKCNGNGYHKKEVA
tara:strand:+ start:1054 stop:1281 length:228 start_codon:yes stop_codon:yes gene_type:complete